MSGQNLAFETRVLRVLPESISFDADGRVLISDAQTRQSLDIASKELQQTNNAIAFPTETVYGLGGLALSDDLVKLIYRAKNRPADNPLIVHVSLVEQLRRRLLPPDFVIPPAYNDIIAEFWPGPLTILLPVLPGLPISKLVTADQPTFAVRIPLHPVARALIALSDLPLAAPSANALTRPSPTRAQHVLNDLNGRIPIILDGGECSVGLELTVIDGLVSPPQLLRPGGILREQLKEAGGKMWECMVSAAPSATATESVRTPGMKYRHYLPTAPVILFTGCGDGIESINRFLGSADCARFCEAETPRIALLRGQMFANGSAIHPSIEIERSMGHNGEEISRTLFHYLRDVDETGVDLILVEGMNTNGAGLAVMNRLSKAAAHSVLI